jgi:hypothetical protein
MDSTPKFIFTAKTEEKTNFSKSIMSAMMCVYFMGVILGMILVIVSAGQDVKLDGSIDSSMFIAYTAYLGGPTATAIGFYAWKSKAENVLKIGQSFKNEQVAQVIETISNMEG